MDCRERRARAGAGPAMVPIQTAPSRVSRMVRMLLSARLSVDL